MSSMIRIASALAGLSGLMFVAFATLSPIELRPTTELGLAWEHVLAFSFISMALTVAFPRQMLAFAAGLAVIAVALEVAQHYVPGRHARIEDAAVKVVGVGLGALIVRFSSIMRKLSL